MSNRNNQQRRVARRFKRTMRATQHHQRGRIDGELCVILALSALMVICALVSIAALCVAIDNADKCGQPTGRIDWEQVPVYPAPDYRLCDLSSKRPQSCITENQKAFARERKREYAALAFERVKP